MALATVEAIRDRVRQLIEYIDPVKEGATPTKFRRYRAENGVEFRDACEANPTGCYRRFHVRKIGTDGVPPVSNMDFAEFPLDLEIVIAYQQTNRSGPDGALDRDDLIEQDWIEIDYNIGICGRGNFAGSYDCTPMGCTKEIERGDAVDFLVITATFLYKRALSANVGLVGAFDAGLEG